MIPIEEVNNKIPYWKKVGGKDLTMLYNGIKMVTGITVGELTLQIIYADSKVRIVSGTGKKEKIIQKYPMNKLRQAEKDFEKLIKQKPSKKRTNSKFPNIKELPNIPKKSNYMLVALPNESLTIYDLRGEKPREIMQFPPNMYKKAKMELMKLHYERD